MSSRTSSRSTFTMVPSTMSPSLKYLIVWSTAARKSSPVPTSFTATCGVLGTVVVSVDMRWVAPVGIVGDSWVEPGLQAQDHLLASATDSGQHKFQVHVD